jgi:hypothetical protein
VAAVVPEGRTAQTTIPAIHTRIAVPLCESRKLQHYTRFKDQ